MPSISPESHARLDALASTLPECVIGLDFDGVLAPIVDDPARAGIHPDAPGILRALAVRTRRVAIITGRPARQAVQLGRLDEVADLLGGQGELHVYGQYGFERWTSAERTVLSPQPPAGLAALAAELPQLLRAAGADQAHVEDKVLALAIHTRRLAEPAATAQRLLDELSAPVARHGLKLEPGRAVLEIRSGSVDKGTVVRELTQELAPRGFLFAGDDLGDIPAFEALAELRRAGLQTLGVFAESAEQNSLRPLADVVVFGPPGVLDLLAELTGRADLIGRETDEGRETN